MQTNELIRALREWAAQMALPGRRELVKQAADRLEELDEAPSVDVVPLDKLCEWMESWDIQAIPCNVCKNVFQLKSCPHGPFDCGDSEHLKMLIKKWMEGQNQ